MIKIHYLKSWSNLFKEAIAERKAFDLRKMDRDFRIGDGVCLEEFDPEKQEYTGQNAFFTITYITSANNPCALSDNGLQDNYCILGIRLEPTTY